MKRIVKVNVQARFGILRVLDSFDSGSRGQAQQIRDLYKLFRLAPEEEEEIELRYISVTESAARGLPVGAIEWNRSKAEAHIRVKEISISESDLLKNALDSYRGYKPSDEWQDDIVDQINAKVSAEEATPINVKKRSAK